MEKGESSLDYRKVNVQRNMVSLYTDAYCCFGWILIYSNESLLDQASNEKVMLKFKRDRKISNKVELTRLQRHFDACVDEICELGKAKSDTAYKAAHSVGFIGSICMCCSALLLAACNLWTSILMAVLGFFGLTSPKFLYNKLVKKKTEELNPLIEQKYDEIYEICEKANALRDSA